MRRDLACDATRGRERIGGVRDRERAFRHGAEQANVVIAFEGVGHRDKDACAAHVFSGAVGGGMSSRLFQEVREKRGLAYSIDTFNWSYDDTGLFGLQAATDPRDAVEQAASHGPNGGDVPGPARPIRMSPLAMEAGATAAQGTSRGARRTPPRSSWSVASSRTAASLRAPLPGSPRETIPPMEPLRIVRRLAALYPNETASRL